MMVEFSVLTEPWIPVETLAGEKREVGILEIFRKAHLLRQVQCFSPLETYSVQRLLIAFLMDAISPDSWKDRRRLFQRGSFDMSIIEEYIQLCETEGSSFDLFDKRHPFMQAAYDPGIDKESKPVAVLYPHLPAGNSHIHFEHRLQNEHKKSPAECVRAICATYTFCTAQVQGYPSSVNNTPCVYLLIKGNNLYETLVLNMLSRQEIGNMAWNKPPVAWRSFEVLTPKKNSTEMSILAGFTWRPRRITLCCPDTDGYINQVYFQQGLNFKGNDIWRDGHVAYRRNKKGLKETVKPQEGRSLWRDIGALSLTKSDYFTSRPMTLEFCEEVSSNILKKLDVEMFALRTRQASLYEWMSDVVSIPIDIICDEFLGENLYVDLIQVDGIADIISRSLSIINGTLAEMARSRFLDTMHDYIFGTYFNELILADLGEEEFNFVEKVNNEIKNAARVAVNKTLDECGGSASALKKNVSVREECLKKCNVQLQRRLKSIG